MKIVSTFVPNLYAIHYPDEDADALIETFQNWEDPMYLFDFFNLNKKDLKNCSVEEATSIINKDVKRFRSKMLELAQLKPHQLNDFFSNFENQESQQTLLPRQKASQKWLRLYAVKIEDDETKLYVITGGMIKLTWRMEEREHGLKERYKLNQCRDFLKDNGVYDAESFFEIIL
jgi:hypothetical protein